MQRRSLGCFGRPNSGGFRTGMYCASASNAEIREPNDPLRDGTAEIEEWNATPLSYGSCTRDTRQVIPMNLPSKPQTRQQRYSARYQARLDASTFARVKDLARAFHRKRSGILRFVIEWGLTQTQGWTVDTVAPVTVHPLSL